MSNSFDLNALYIEEEGENEIIEENDTATDLLRHAAHVLEGNEDNQPAIEPTVGAEFDSGEQFAAFCFTYAYKTGFELHIRSSQLLAPFREQGVHRNGVGDKEPRFHMMNKFRLMCSEGNTTKKRSCITPCKMYVFGKLNHDIGKFVICTCDLVHNHELNPEVSRHVVNYRHISEYFKTRLMLNNRAGIPISRNFNTLVREVGGIHNLHFNGQDARNFINNERRKTRFRGDAKDVLYYFEGLKAQNPYFYYAIEMDADNKLLNIFWSDARCCAMYKAFGDPSSFDSTFLSNRYQMPFCAFVGVNHHGSTVLYASALISYEDTESFEWVFEKWMECMGRAPTVLLTDQCKAMEEIDKDLRTLVHESITEEELQEMWDDFMEKYNLRRNKWLRGAWDMGQRWMPVFWKDTLCAEKNVEDEKVNNAKDIKSPHKWDPLILFEDIYSKVYTNSKFGEVKTEVYGCISTNVETLPNSLGFIKRFRATSKVTEAFWKEDRRSFEVSIDTITGEYKCGCKMFEFRGILCRHILKCLDVLDVKGILDKYILDRLRKDLVRVYENIRVGYYNPDESKRVKRSLEITVKNDYIKRLAMQSEGSSAIYTSRTDELIKELEAHAGIQTIDSFAACGVS
ncbi:protein FAR1-RELATED SEQUENCE 5-like [Silene latifolia]|uniref:protein FAR1-RELATED SEQUENCE 5-like n=1 Tax=Silene latifolia TaxID=37657 RepID=UPI003D77C6E8